jgi:ATP-dependent DNA helicase RecQ
MRLGTVLRQLAPKRVLACTATATPAVRSDILEQLELDPNDTPVVLRGFARPNLHLEVVEIEQLGARRVYAMKRLREILGLVQEPRGAAIVYAGTRRLTEKVAALLCERGWRCRPYHAGIESQEREAVNADFAHGRLDVVVATNAFGMGIDRADIRVVIHLQAPGSIEQYYQEVGRAGRDGEPAVGLLLSGTSDFGLRRRLIEYSSDRTFDDPHEAQAEEPAADAAAIGSAAWNKARQWKQFLDLMRYVEAGSCRHDFILGYFEDEAELLGGCGHCDVCERIARGDTGDEQAAEDTALVLRKALSGVARLRCRAGLTALAGSLHGATTQRIERLGLTALSTHGLLSDYPEAWIISLLRRLITAGLVEVTEDQFPVPFLTPLGAAVMRGEQPARVLLPPRDVGRRAKVPRTKKRGGARAEVAELDNDADHSLFEQLRQRRSDLAKERGVPAYVVCTNRSLTEIAQQRPTSADALAEIHGMGPSRIENYGEALLEITRAEASAEPSAEPSGDPQACANT